MGLTLEKLLIEIDGFSIAGDLTVSTGRRVALIGPSGAGKSTLAAAIAGFITPARGRILWEGRDITALPPGDRPLTLLFQDHNLFPHMSVADNVALGLRPSLRLSAAESARVDRVLDRVGLAGQGAKRPGALSGGQQSRAALARVLLRDRPLLLLDEPFAALGPALKAEMLALVEEIATEAGLTVLMITHDPADAERLAQETILVADGRAAPPVATGDLFADPPPALRAYLG
ncbi:ATP-binding cassette domain-containing protein [Rhodovulum sp. YNF3179]|uniref:thiamine ABC transporter ATP-binding protein n=1 Tax=Rhodovulum sp. YNF3179 TaxID=3425127 RepID=UPI003D333FED